MTRREVIGVTLGFSVRVAAIRAAPRDEFWETKPPSGWSAEEIKRITTDSPWAQSPSVYSVRDERDRPWSERTPLDYPRADKAHGVIVRWESSRVIQDALRANPNDELTKFYVINFPGDTWISRSLHDKTKLPARLLELRHYTKLEPQRRSIVVDHIVELSKGPSRGILFYFPRRRIMPEDEQVRFVTVIDSFRLESRFALKDMLYHGHLAL
jgi:hypothetical protein